MLPAIAYNNGLANTFFIPEWTIMLKNNELLDLHRKIHNAHGKLFTAPGRVNLIGEHTDYCDGFVMPAAIDFYTHVAVSPRTDGRVHAHSVNFGQDIDLSVEQFTSARRGHWSDYPAGVLWSLRQRNIPVSAGFDFTIDGNVPVGAGLSSSASFEVATALAVLDVAGVSLPMSEVAQICQRAENGFVGANSGIMDQFVICCGAQDHALMLDCRSLEYQLAPIPDHVRIVICNSMVKHSHSDGAYNTRRAEIEQGTQILRAHRPEIKALRDATEDDLARWGHEMPENVFRRCRHVITEDNRVLAAVDAFNNSDLRRFGELMKQAHASFRDDFEASCAEVDILVNLAVQQPGCYGSRLTGGGFGGCTVNLVAAEAVEEFVSVMHQGYLKATGIDSEIYKCRASGGAHAIVE